jgi:hypothetical protein
MVLAIASSRFDPSRQILISSRIDATPSMARWTAPLLAAKAAAAPTCWRMDLRVMESGMADSFSLSP